MFMKDKRMMNWVRGRPLLEWIKDGVVLVPYVVMALIAWLTNLSIPLSAFLMMPILAVFTNQNVAMTVLCASFVFAGVVILMKATGEAQTLKDFFTFMQAWLTGELGTWLICFAMACPALKMRAMLADRRVARRIQQWNQGDYFPHVQAAWMLRAGMWKNRFVERETLVDLLSGQGEWTTSYKKYVMGMLLARNPDIRSAFPELFMNTLPAAVREGLPAAFEVAESLEAWDMLLGLHCLQRTRGGPARDKAMIMLSSRLDELMEEVHWRAAVRRGVGNEDYAGMLQQAG